MWWKTNSLNILLPVFILTGILLLVHEVRSGHELYHSEGGLTGTVAHRPAEFPQIFDSFDPLQGLEHAKGDVSVAPPPMDDEYWPCSQCHEKETNNPHRRKLTIEHTSIQLHHGEGRWCLDCHDPDNRDMLHLTDGEKIPFTQSYRLCGQCHGDKYRDWKIGIHGKRTGYWNGSKRYYQCVGCHNPHNPHFKPLQPLPPPVRPEFLRAAPMVPVTPVRPQPNVSSTPKESVTHE